jgi:CDP-diacylglycerol---serine O-phosphatidyltransferase
VTSPVRERWDAARGRWRIRAVRGGKWFRERGKKGLSMLPHLFTLLNLAFGFLSIILTMQGNFRQAALMVAASLLADGLDGRLARAFGADGEFGKQMDSLADIVSFGVAPALLAYVAGLHQFGFWGLLIAVIFPMCGALRLARFAIIKTSGFFLGVPITAGGTLVASLVWYSDVGVALDLTEWIFPVVMVVVSYLMISTIPYPDFKTRRDIQPGPAQVAGPILVTVGLLAAVQWDLRSLLLVPLVVYATLGPWLLLIRHWREKVKPWMAGADRN